MVVARSKDPRRALPRVRRELDRMIGGLLRND
jgi:hypothetical protein